MRRVWVYWQRSDDLGLRRGLGDRMLPLLVAAMAFLAAMALAGALAAAALAQHWQGGAEAALTVQVPHPEFGELTMMGIVPKLSATPGRIWRAGAGVGAHTADVLRGRLGLNDEQIRALEKDGIIRCADAPGADHHEGGRAP